MTRIIFQKFYAPYLSPFVLLVLLVAKQYCTFGVMIKTKDDITRLIVENKQKLRSYGANRIGLFGSFAEGTATDASDIDILVEFEPGKKNFKTYTGIYFFLKELFRKEIDLLTPESLSPYIGPHILKSVKYVSLNN